MKNDNNTEENAQANTNFINRKKKNNNHLMYMDEIKLCQKGKRIGSLNKVSENI